MSRRYAAVAALPRRFAIPVPVLTPRLSSHWVKFVTPIPRALAASLMDSLENDVVCAEHDIADYIPDPEGGLTPYEESVELAWPACARGRAAHPVVATRRRGGAVAPAAHRSGVVGRLVVSGPA